MMLDKIRGLTAGGRMLVPAHRELYRCPTRVPVAEANRLATTRHGRRASGPR